MTASNIQFLLDLEALIENRKNDDTANGYTASLFQSGIKRIAQKVGEEGVEVALAAVASEPDDVIDESADLLYHLLVLLSACDIPFASVVDRLQDRRN